MNFLFRKIHALCIPLLHWIQYPMLNNEKNKYLTSWRNIAWKLERA